jgi:hypothetical protein
VTFVIDADKTTIVSGHLWHSAIPKFAQGLQEQATGFARKDFGKRGIDIRAQKVEPHPA